MHTYVVYYDVCETLTDEHLETIQRTRVTTNTGTRIKETRKDFSVFAIPNKKTKDIQPFVLHIAK